MTAEVEIVTTPFHLMGEGQDNGLLSEIARGMGMGMKVDHLKKLDYILDKAKAEAGAKGLLDEMERVQKEQTANLNIIRPALLLGIMSRTDFSLRDWESIIDSSNIDGEEVDSFKMWAKNNLWYMLAGDYEDAMFNYRNL